MTETSKQAKERLAWIGKMVQPAIVALLFALGGWIFMINSEIAAIKASMGENAAQWKVLYEQGQEIDDLVIDVKVSIFCVSIQCDPLPTGVTYCLADGTLWQDFNRPVFQTKANLIKVWCAMLLP